jgi:asparagine synthase (glutamine-hydrolysing)
VAAPQGVASPMPRAGHVSPAASATVLSRLLRARNKVTPRPCFGTPVAPNSTPMCGLAGLLHSDALTADALMRAVEAMIAPIAHRGPDDSGVWADPAGGVALGFRRLSIIDLSPNGHQPMQSASGRFTMVFNGEVYNFQELRRELETSGAPPRFRGRSDSEVMLAAFERWGVEQSLPRFVGMFALAVWDAAERTLFLARDRFGKKPLFIYSRPGFVSFGSEIKALVAGPAFDRTLDPEALTAYLRYLYVPAPATIYRHVRKLEPGHLLTIRDIRAPLPRSVPYWVLEEVARRGLADPFTGSDAEGIAEVERLIDESARLRMIADVPLGAFLSGGIDSSTVVAVMQRASPRPVRTFSVAFDDADFNEADHAARVAQHLGTDHTEIRLTADDALALVPRIADWFDEPLADPSQLPTFLICQEARREVTVAVSGDGGDEVFAGYNRYAFGERVIAPALGVPAAARRLVAAGIGAMTPGSWDRLYEAVAPVLPGGLRHRLPGDKLHKLGSLLRTDSPRAMYRSLLSAWQDPAPLVVGGRDTPGVVDRILEADGTGGASLLDRMMLADQLGYLPDDLLAKVDRVSMAVSLEVRVPLLDHRVVEFAWRLPRRFKIRDGRSKWVLRQVLARHVPAQLVDRPKMGFSIPIDRWLRGSLREWAEALLAPDRLKAAGALEPRAVRRAWDDFVAGRGRAGAALWAVLQFQAWHERWIGRA